MLNYTRFDPIEAPLHPPLVIAHGLYGSGRNWRMIAKRLADSRSVITVDMRNHAGSFWNDNHSYPALAADLQGVIADIGAPVDLLGHSMGGKAAMVCALNHSANIRRLIVADIAPVAYTHTQTPMITAMKSIDFTQVLTRNDVDKELSRIIDAPPLRAFLMQSLDLAGKSWWLNLKALEHQMPHIIGFPDMVGEFAGPCLFLTGAQSDYVLPQHRAKIQSLFPKTRFVKIPNAGHWLHAEKPKEFIETVRVFLG